MILDTNAISDFADANQRLLDRIQLADDDIHLRVIVLGEYRYGLKSSRALRDGAERHGFKIGARIARRYGTAPMTPPGDQERRI